MSAWRRGPRLHLWAGCFQEWNNCWAGLFDLEAQQRYFSYRAMLLAIVSQNSFVLVFMGYRTTIIARYVAKWGIAQMCLFRTKWGVSHHFGELLTSLKKYRAIWGITAIVSQYRAIWGHYVCRRGSTRDFETINLRMQLFGLQLDTSCLQLSFFAYSCVWELLSLQLELLYLQVEVVHLQLKFFAYSGKVRLIST